MTDNGIVKRKEVPKMPESIRYRLIMIRLRAEIARTVRRSAPVKNTRAEVKPTCKVCGSIV